MHASTGLSKKCRIVKKCKVYKVIKHCRKLFDGADTTRRFIWSSVFVGLWRPATILKILFQSNLHSASWRPSCVYKVPYVSPPYFVLLFFLVLLIKQNCIQVNDLILFAQMSVISCLQGIPQISFFLVFILWGLAGPVKDFNNLKPFQFWVGWKFLFLVLLEHYCPSLRSLALWIKLSLTICLYLVPCVPAKFPSSCCCILLLTAWHSQQHAGIAGIVVDGWRAVYSASSTGNYLWWLSCSFFI